MSRTSLANARRCFASRAVWVQDVGWLWLLRAAGVPQRLLVDEAA